ncbi:MAG: succinoglycan biosynthesis protein [Caulobacteraceae bacterium]|nr:succinoglycan biosynthesis protein [Caulobacteraceae bacterium]
MVDVPRWGVDGEALPAANDRQSPIGEFGRAQEARSFLDEDAPGRWAFDAKRHIDLSQDVSPGSLEVRALAVIPCLNEAAHIAPLIQRLLADDRWSDPLVVVADGGSTDGSREIVSGIAASDPRVRLLDNPRRLQSAGVNLAAATFGRDRRWMVRVDAHCDYPANYVSGLVAEARRVGAASVVVSMCTKGRGGFQNAAAAAQNSVLGAGGSAHRGSGRSGWVDHGHHALFDMEHFLGAGGYDETFGANEDAEFDVRLAQAKGRIWLSHELQVTYYPRTNAPALFRQYLNYGQGRARTLLRHHVRPKLRQLLPVAVAPAVIAMPLALIEPALALPGLIWASASLALGAVIGVRKRDPAAAASGVAAMIMHMAWSLGFWRQLLIAGRPKTPARPPVGDVVRS